MLRKTGFVFVVVFALLAASAAPALASDHLFNASHAAGVVHRGFANPVAASPSGTSGAMARPATVPGEGDPKAGLHQGTPSVDLALVNARSGGHGMPTIH